MRILILILFSTILYSAEPIGKIIAIEGHASAISEGVERLLAQNSEIFVQEIVDVALNSKVQIQFTDGGIVNLIANTKFRVNSYKFKKVFQTDQSSSELLQGGIKALSGEIAKINPNAYELRTPTATIGLRGTVIEAVIRPNGLFVGISFGKALVTNAMGSAMIGLGERSQFAVVPGANFSPEFLTQRPIALSQSVFNSPAGGVSIDQVQQQRLSTTTTPPPSPSAPSTGTAPTGTAPSEAPSTTTGGASIQGGC